MIYCVYMMSKSKCQSYVIENKKQKLEIENLKILNDCLNTRIEVLDLQYKTNKDIMDIQKSAVKMKELNEDVIDQNRRFRDDNVKLINQISILEFEIKNLEGEK